MEEKSGDVNFTLTDINGQPALNVTGKGNTSLKFYMESEEQKIFSYIKNSNKNGTKIFLQRSSNEPVSILMEDTLKNWETLHDSREKIQITLTTDGWQSVHMDSRES
ncbi:MAG: hypothetical protein QF366_03830 [Candidatus Poseidoniia archaeon]|nr:hypothetical protein [Candidatus Poseidoniia archaeon]MDP6658927.1 hypothetical protein [Candidatus Poseidoniia archaeon]MDP6846750.1 hypothetical protein [Candidatus Poseidoniia archaeon]MDP7007728.1 hypothetical protein [Candidatus Poseidoniia archaeon]HIH78643.1 hypothetical protein [Candidatus Poseidoniia archaeon]